MGEDGVFVVGSKGAECVERVRAATGWGCRFRPKRELKRRAGRNQWGESEGDTRCSHRYCKGREEVGKKRRGWKWRLGDEGVGNGGGAVSRLEWEERVGKVGEGLTDAMRTSEGKKDVEAAIVLGGGREVEATRAMLDPGWSGLEEMEVNHKLAGGGGWGWKAKRKGTRCRPCKAERDGLGVQSRR
jgi:hypothetical protein